MTLFDVDVPAVGEKLEPVLLEIIRGCHFKAKPNSAAGGRRLGCARCGRSKRDDVHYGAPKSINVFGSGNPKVYWQEKMRWQELLTAQLEGSGLLRPLARVMVEGEAVFPDRIKRDQGNHRVIVEKALGDALVVGGWLEDDDWSRYEFGNLFAAYEHGVSATRLTLFPTAA
jgi:hypothetical protein